VGKRFRKSGWYSTKNTYFDRPNSEHCELVFGQVLECRGDVEVGLNIVTFTHGSWQFADATDRRRFGFSSSRAAARQGTAHCQSDLGFVRLDVGFRI